MCVHLLAVARQVLTVELGGLAQSPEQLLEMPLALNLRNSTGRSRRGGAGRMRSTRCGLFTARQFCPKLREVCAAVLDDDRLAVNDGWAGNIESARNPREALGLVDAVAGKDGPAAAARLQLHPVAVVLYLIEPLTARGRLRLKRGELRLDESWHSRRLRAFGRDAGRRRTLGPHALLKEKARRGH